MNDALVADVLDRLDEAGLPEEVHLPTYAALLGELDDWFDGKQPERPNAAGAEVPEPVGAYIESISVEGFRGIGASAKLELQPGPGLTLVVGRNGSGKSSFAEALEVLLTGDNQRWSKRGKMWRDGWRNLHQSEKARVEAELLIEERKGTYKASRAWETGGAIESSSATVGHGGEVEPLSSLGWEQPLGTYRPFLSYNELSTVLEEGQAQLYDALGSILGLEDVTDAADALKDARTTKSSAHKQVNSKLKELRSLLEASEDLRASDCLAALKGKKWKLEVVDGLVDGDAGSNQEETRLLQQLGQLEPLDLEEIEARATRLREALAARKAVAGTGSERSSRLAEIIEQATALHTHDGDGDCPVCGQTSALSAEWHARAELEARRLRQEAKAADDAHTAVQQSQKRLRELLVSPPTLLAEATSAGIALDELATAWREWHAVAALEDEALARRVEDGALTLHGAIEVAQAEAGRILAERDDEWRPIARQILQWLPGAKQLLAEAESLKQLKAGEDWLRETAVEMQNERFVPIKAKVKRIWELLRTQSNVDLDDVIFEGKTTSRRITLEVTVDGTAGAALGVMSQGELHSLALALFLPRATLEASPFRFLIIDDPVQSMDPSRVDGLARVLQEVSQDRQVVVFTHDDRLPDAVRRMGIPAEIIAVDRKAGSNVTLRKTRSPYKQYLDDAFVMAMTNDMPAVAIRRVVPGLCRQSLEAACMDVIRRKRLSAGVAHKDVEKLLDENPKLLPRLALALFDDADRAKDVYATINNRFAKKGGYRDGPLMADIIRACNEGAHQGLIEDDPRQFVRLVEGLAEKVASL